MHVDGCESCIKLLQRQFLGNFDDLRAEADNLAQFTNEQRQGWDQQRGDDQHGGATVAVETSGRHRESHQVWIPASIFWTWK